MRAFNFELVKGFRVLANGLWGHGIGRYLIGFGPQTVVVPIATGPGTFDLDVSMVHSGAVIVGSEIQRQEELVRLLLRRHYTISATLSRTLPLRS